MYKIKLGMLFVFLFNCLSCINLNAGFEDWNPLDIKTITGKHYIVAAFLRSLMKGKLEVQSDTHKPAFLIKDTKNFSMPINDACIILQKLNQRLNQLQPPKILLNQKSHDLEKVLYKKTLLAFYNFKKNNDLDRLASATDWNRLSQNRQVLLDAFIQGHFSKILTYCDKPYTIKHMQQKNRTDKSSCVLL